MIAAFRRQTFCRRGYHVRSKSNAELSGRYITSKCRYCNFPMRKDYQRGWVLDNLRNKQAENIDVDLHARDDQTYSVICQDAAENSSAHLAASDEGIVDEVNSARMSNLKMLTSLNFAAEHQKMTNEPHPSAKTELEIVLGGARIHVRGDFDQQVLRAVFDALRT